MSIVKIANPNRGTPKTIEEAVKNGFEDIKVNPTLDPAHIMKINVRDFLAQKFGAHMSEDSMQLWRKIFPEKA